jgi:molybdopterin molybdotransferase
MALIPVADALAAILDGVTHLESEVVGLRYALHRTLSGPVAARLDSPPFDSSAMDGYAVRAIDCSFAPKTLRLIGQAAAGHSFAGAVGPDEAVRIFTGAPLPPGADAVVIQENTEPQKDTVLIREAVGGGANVRPRAQDFADGDDVLSPGQQLNARHILLAATAGHAVLPVVRRPVVAILSTGDELVEPGEDRGDAEIYASNGYGLAALVELAGGRAQIIHTADDTAESLRAKLLDADDCDILVTCGGASVGDHDIVRPTLEAAGAHLIFHKIAMRPGKPLFYGTRECQGATQRILGLPGNPVSAMLCARLFLVPLIAALLGRPAVPQLQTAVLAHDLAANGPRDHYMRARVEPAPTGPLVSALPSQDSSLIRILADANCLIVVPANAPPAQAGDTVQIMPIDF